MRNRPSIREKYRIDVLPTVTLLTLLTIDAPKLSLLGASPLIASIASLVFSIDGSAEIDGAKCK